MSEILIPRPIHYCGGWTRSALEGRWLVFLDALAVRWRYEPVELLVNGRSYLPDLYLAELGAYVEIKPAGHEPDLQDRALYGTVANRWERPLLLIAGPPKLGEYRVTLFRPGMEPEHGMRFAVGRRDHAELWLCSIESGIACCLSERSIKGNWPVVECHALREAYRAAMGWRFEEGG